MRNLRLPLIAFVMAMGLAIGARAADHLAEEFRNPPDSAKPQTWWHWMNGNITKEGITADLEAMKRVGIGGAQIFAVDWRIPPGKVTFMSDPYRDMIHHAMIEANRLGLEMGVHNCPGWSSSGGPWVTPDRAMQVVVMTETHVKGPAKFNGLLPQPTWNAKRPQIKVDYYRDIAVLAYPTPVGSAMIKDIADAALFNPDPLEIKVTNPPSDGEPIDRTRIVDISTHLTPDGTLTWDIPAGDWTILRIGHAASGQLNRHPPLGGEGLECDKLSKEAVDAHWAGMLQKLLDDSGPLAGKTFDNILIDSYEVGDQNWTPKMREEFRRLRGYDMTPFFPVMSGRIVESRDISERFLWDLRRTVADLMAENYYGHFADLCHARHLKFCAEPYIGPFESMQVGAAADIPMGEFDIDHGVDPSLKLAASIGHIDGKNIIGAESFTSISKWQEYPYSLKSLGDLVFTHGINRLTFHRYAHQPWLDRATGMTMGQYGSHFERTNTWFEQSSAWLKYLTRCQYLLQQGRFIADIAYFTGESAPIEITADNPAAPLGYDWDAVSADALLHHASVKGGRLLLDSGMTYAALVLAPDETSLRLPVLQKIKDLALAGVTIIAAKPVRTPGLEGFPQSETQLKAIAAEWWDSHRIRSDISLASVLASKSLPPDFESAKPLAYIHRRTDDADIYFLSNQRDHADSIECTFRVSNRIPELWHPDTGEIEDAAAYRQSAGRTTAPIEFDPCGSVFVIFRQPWDGKEHHALAQAERIDSRQIAGTWTLNFPPHLGAPPSVQLGDLISWTDHADPGVKYFSGTATYTKDIDIPADWLAKGNSIDLDLGDVKYLAEVSLNGQNLGILWKPPFRVKFNSAARPGLNHLEIRVTDLWPNRLIGDEQLPPDSQWRGAALARWPQFVLDGKPSPTGRIAFTTWRHYTKNMQPLPSGLLGPVKLELHAPVAR